MRPAMARMAPGGGADAVEKGLVALRVKSRCSREELTARLRGERQVLHKVGLQLCACFFFMVYGAGLLFRNIAFYRYQGLDSYAELVVPQSANVPAEAAWVVDAATGEATPLRAALRASWRTRSEVNVSIAELGATANLTALHGRPFNLKDFAAEYLPNLSAARWAVLANEVVALLFQHCVIVFCFMPFAFEFQGCERPYATAMLYRLERSLATVHLLRVPTYLATTIPGAANHCQSTRWATADGQRGGAEVGQAHVQTVWQWFFDGYNMKHNSNCGDLIFSGHAATSLTDTLFVHYYTRKLLPEPVSKVVIVIAWAFSLVQIFFILCTHNHYTVDVVVASYVAPLNFLANLHFFPTDEAGDVQTVSREASERDVVEGDIELRRYS